MGVPVNYNLRNLVERKGTTLMTAVGIGLTVAVLVTALALTEGLKSVFGGTGDPRQLIVLRKGVDAELTSSVSSEAYQIIRQLPGIAKTPDGEPMVSPEGLTVVNLPSVDSPEGMNVTVRGMLPSGLTMRTVTITQGKLFAPGLRQIIVGESIARRYPDARLGKQVRFGRGLWEVVGVFRVGESAANSEIWVDLNQLRGDFERADDGREDQAPDDGTDADFKLKRDLTKGDEAADAGGQAVNRHRDQNADDAAEQRQADRLEHERSQDRPAAEADGAQRADLPRAAGDGGVHRVRRRKRAPDRHDDRDGEAQRLERRAGRGLVCVILFLTGDRHPEPLIVVDRLPQ